MEINKKKMNNLGGSCVGGTKTIKKPPLANNNSNNNGITDVEEAVAINIMNNNKHNSRPGVAIYNPDLR